MQRGRVLTSQHARSNFEAHNQGNFEARLGAFTATLKSSLTELELMGVLDMRGASEDEEKPYSRDIFLIHGRDDGC